MEALSDIQNGGTSAFGPGGLVSGVCTITPTGGQGVTYWRETITLAGVSPANRIFLSLAPHLPTDINDPEMLFVQSLCAIPGTGSFVVQAAFGERTSGPIKLNYMVI